MGCEAWASFGLSNMGRMPAPRGRPVILFADRGSEDQTRKAAEQLADCGVTVSVAPPPEGYKDVNEALVAGEPEKITEALGKAVMVNSGYDTLPRGYTVRQDGWIVKEPHETTSDELPKPICSGLKIIGIARDASGKGWGQVAEIETVEGQVHRTIIAADEMIGSGLEAIKRLARLGLRIAVKQEEQLRILIAYWRPRQKYRTVDRLGWTDASLRTFVLGDGSSVSGPQVEPVAVPDHLLRRGGICSSGTLDDWQHEVAAKAAGNPLLAFAICVAFAGPLLDLLNQQGGGVHLVGESSRGKTTALRASVSVWGAPELAGSWRATVNGLEAIAARANSTSLFLDEISQVEPKDAGETAYMLANGQGKARGKQDGGARESATWRLNFLSTGEIGLPDKMAEGNQKQRAGQAVRLVDIPATGQAHGLFDDLHGCKSAPELADQVNRATATIYGHAGPIFVAGLVSDIEAATRTARHITDGFVEAVRKKHPEADGQVLRVAKHFGLILAGGTLAIHFGIIVPLTEVDISLAVWTAFDLWLGKRGGTEALEKQEALKAVRAFLQYHGSSRFEMLEHDTTSGNGTWKPKSDQRVHNRVGWYRPAGHGYDEAFLISKDAWISDVVPGLDPTRAAQVMKGMGLLEYDKGRLTKKLPRGIGGNSGSAYTVLATVIGAGEREDDA